MKNLLYLSIISLLLTGCNYSINKDFVTGMKTTGSGLSCDDIYLEIDGEKVKQTVFTYGEKVFIKCNNITGFKRKGGVANVGMAIKVINTKSKEVAIENFDLFSDNAGFSEDPLLLIAKITTAFPYKDGEKYEVSIHIWDKDGEGVFDIELPFTVEASKLIDIESNKINCSSVYFWDELNKKTVTDNKIDFEKGVLLILEGTKGLEVVDGLVYPGFSIELVDNSGKTIISQENIIESLTAGGVNPTDLEKTFPVTLSFRDRELVNPVKLKAVLFDAKSGEKLTIRSSLNIQ